MVYASFASGTKRKMGYFFQVIIMTRKWSLFLVELFQRSVYSRACIRMRGKEFPCQTLVCSIAKREDFALSTLSRPENTLD